MLFYYCGVNNLLPYHCSIAKCWAAVTQFNNMDGPRWAYHHQKMHVVLLHVSCKVILVWYSRGICWAMILAIHTSKSPAFWTCDQAASVSAVFSTSSTLEVPCDKNALCKLTLTSCVMAACYVTTGDVTSFLSLQVCQLHVSQELWNHFSTMGQCQKSCFII